MKNQKHNTHKDPTGLIVGIIVTLICIVIL